MAIHKRNALNTAPIKKERLSADWFLAAMAYEFPGLFHEYNETKPYDILLETPGEELVAWIKKNRIELKKNVLGNCEREACIRLSEKVGAK